MDRLLAPQASGCHRCHAARKYTFLHPSSSLDFTCNYVCKMYHDMRSWNDHLLAGRETGFTHTHTHTQGICIYMVQLNVVSHRADKQERGAVNGSKTVTCASGSPQLLNVLPVLFLTSLGKKSERHFWTTKCCLATTTLLEVKVTTPHSRPTTPQQKINALDSDFDPAWKPGMTKMYSHCGSFFIYFSTVNREEYEM